MRLDIEREYMDFMYSNSIDLAEFKRIQKPEDLFNNYNPLIVSEDQETGTLLIRKMLKFGGSASYVYRLVRLDGSATEPKNLFNSQYQCQLLHKYMIEAMEENFPKKSFQATFRFLAGIITYSEYLKRRELIGDDSDISF